MSPIPEPEPEEPDDGKKHFIPRHEPPHSHFFEEGEEPPQRYDLDDELDYLLPRDYEIDSREWSRLAQQHLNTCWGKMIGYSAAYLGLFILGCLCMGLPYLLVLDPPVLAGLTIVSLNQLTGRPEQYGRFFGGFRRFGRHLACTLPISGSFVLTYVGTYLSFLYIISTDELWLWPLPVSILVTGIGVVLFINVRLFCFAQQLIVDRDFGAVEAVRACWILSGKHFWRLFWLKLKLLLLLLLFGGLTLGIGLIFVMPYTNLVWTAAYLDIAGKRPIVDEEAPEGPEPEFT